ncbi:iron uptake protein [Bordetella pertussis]|nr:iron uptake protein [Bordetella pertussis]
MVGTGLALWIAKRRQKAAGRESFALRLVDALNAGSIAGLCVAVAAFFWANRLLPAALPQHAQWEVRIFFGAWLLCGLYAAVARRRKWRTCGRPSATWGCRCRRATGSWRASI